MNKNDEKINQNTEMQLMKIPKFMLRVWHLIGIGLLIFMIISILVIVKCRNNKTEISSSPLEDSSSYLEGNLKNETNIKQEPEENIDKTQNSNMNYNLVNLPVLTEKGKENIENIYRTKDKKIAYLTFDDGPSKKVTPLLLDYLKNENIKVTFFVLGNMVDKNPEILKRAYNEGHYIANHGYTHEYSKIYASCQNVLDEFNKTEESIRKALGIENYNSNLFRFPGGLAGGKYAEVKLEAKELLNNNNILNLDWNALTEDSIGKPTKEQMYNKLVETTKGKNSIVILMHDANDKMSTYELLPEIIDYLRNEGYTFGNMYDLIK